MTDADEAAIQLPKATIRALDLKGGEIVVLHYATFKDVSHEGLAAWLDGVNETLREQDKAKVRVLVLIGSETVEALDETQMRLRGWLKREPVEALLRELAEDARKARVLTYGQIHRIEALLAGQGSAPV